MFLKELFNDLHVCEISIPPYFAYFKGLYQLARVKEIQ